MIEVAKNAGFCYGVRRAVEMAEEASSHHARVHTLGPLIHNPQMVAELSEKGVCVAEDAGQIPEGGVAVIRCHGVGQATEEALRQKGVTILDATCPSVRRIHKLAKGCQEQNLSLIIVGDRRHPEVIGISGWAQGPVHIVSGPEEADTLPPLERAMAVSQTTLERTLFDETVARMKARIPGLIVEDTICLATTKRQTEAEQIARRADVMLVVGGRNSANTRKLYELSKQWCPQTYIIETAQEIPFSELRVGQYIGITAGASTPDSILKEVVARMNDFENQELTNTPDTAQEPVTENEAVLEAAQSEADGANEQTPAEAAPEVVVESNDATPESTEDASSEEQEPLSAEAQFMADFEKTLVRIRAGQTITGTVVQITEDEVCVNIGYKSDGVVKKSDLTVQDVKVGDEIEVEIVKVNDGEGNVLLSQRNIINRKSWEAILEKYESGEFVTGLGKESVKGGLIANVNGVRAFVPASQLSLRYVERIDEFVGKEMQLKIIEVDKSKKRIVASRKAVLQEEEAQRKGQIWETLVEGQIVKGTVRRLTDFGAFVDIGGVDGLVHVTDLSWGRVRHPSDVVSINQQIDVMILSLDKARERISLGYKQTQPRPWDTAAERYLIGSVVEGKVVRITTFGAFVELEPGLDGLVHISQCALTRIAKVEDAVTVGDIVRVKVLDVNPEAKRISLSIRAVLEDEAYAQDMGYGDQYVMVDGYQEGAYGEMQYGTEYVEGAEYVDGAQYAEGTEYAQGAEGAEEVQPEE